MVTAMRAFLGVLLTAFLCAAPALAAEKRVALVIGNSAYAETGALANPRNDAALMAHTLRSVGFTVTVLLDADQTAMKRAMLEFGRTLRAGADAGLFYYAGHGVQVKGENFLIPVDAALSDESEVDLQAINVNDFLGVMEGSASKVNIVILDACRNNPFARSFRSASRGLAMVDAPEGSYVAFATAPGQVAADGDGGNSPYTAALAAAMIEPGMKLEETFKKARRMVIEATARQQVPWETTSVTGDFFFVPKEGAPAAAGDPAPATETAALPPAKAEPAKPPAPAPGVLAMGKADIPQTYLFDFDAKAVREEGGDLWFEAETADDLFLTPQNGAMLAAGDYSKRDAFQCRDGAYSAERLPVKAIPGEAFICIATSEGRIGSFRIDAMSPTSPRTLSINYAVWDMAKPGSAETKVAALSGGGKLSPRSLPINACDRFSALVLDADKPVRLRGAIRPPTEPEAVPACRKAVADHPGVARYVSQLAMALWGAGDEAGARKLFEEAAASGHAAASFGLAILKGRGVGGEADEATALRHMREADAAGYIVATFALAEAHERGNAILPKDTEKAGAFARRARSGLDAAIAAGDPDAGAMLAQLFLADPGGSLDTALVGKLLLDGVALQSRVAIALFRDTSAVDKLNESDRRTAEQFLADHGMDPGPVDGVIDEATKTALAKWENAGPAPAAERASLPSADDAGPVGTSEKAKVYVERKGAAPEVGDATVDWNFAESGEYGPELRATILVAEGRGQIDIAIRRNVEAALPASHLITINTAARGNKDGARVGSVAGLLVKPSESAAGTALVGAVTKVVDDYFLMALSAKEADVATNLGLLRDGAWFELALTSDAGDRAIVAFPKGRAGGAAMARALSAWEIAAKQ
jgi:TPR repeat protein